MNSKIACRILAVILIGSILFTNIAASENDESRPKSKAHQFVKGRTYVELLKGAPVPVDAIRKGAIVIEKAAIPRADKITALKLAPDRFEPDNFPANASPIGIGQTQAHTIHVDGDVDWMVVTLHNRDILTIETSNLSGSNPDTVLELFDNNCTFLAGDDDGGVGLASRLVWSVTYDGPHFIKARTYGGSYGHCNDQGGGPADCSYNITVTVTNPCAIADTYEPDNLPADATAIANGQTQLHTVHTDGDVDWMAIDLLDGDTLIVETSNLRGSNADTVLELYDNNCNMLTRDDNGGVAPASRLEWITTYSGIHYIKALTAGGTYPHCNDQGGGPADCCYDISVTVPPRCDLPDLYEPDNLPVDATPIADGQTQPHMIHVDGDVDWMTINLLAGYTLIVETSNLSGSNPDTVLELYDNNCNMLTRDDNGGVAPASRIEWKATYSGPHYIKALTAGGTYPHCNDQGGGPADCCYDISVTIPPRCDIPDTYEPDNFPANATTILSGQKQSHTIHVDGDVDWMAITLQTGDTCRIETGNLFGSNADTVLELYDPNWNMLARDDNGGIGSASRINWTATYSGAHFIKALTAGGSYPHYNDQGGGPADCCYDIIASTSPICDLPDVYEPDNFPTNATPIDFNQVQTHTIDVDGDVDWMAITLQAGDRFRAQTSNLSGTNPDTVLELYDNNCNYLTYDDDGGVGAASRLEWTATYTGAHWLKVRTFGGSRPHCNDQGGGPADCCYDIAITKPPRCNAADTYEPDNFPADATPITDGQSQLHTIHVNGDVDWMVITMQSGCVLRVETSNLSGTNADTVLELYDNNCNYLAIDDDGGAEPLASLLQWTATYDGPHFIKARTYGGSAGYCNNQGGGPADCCYDITVTVPFCWTPPPPAADPEPADRATGVPLDTMLCWNGGMPCLGENKTIRSPKIIYGRDDRLDECLITDPAILTAGDSTVALMARSELTDNGDGTFSLPAETFAQYWLRIRSRPLCADEPFQNQPNPAWCSGFLVAPDILATAGHCVSNTADCANVAFVFGLVMLDLDMDPRDCETPVLRIDGSEIYFCREIIHSQAAASDWALIRLDRPVVNHCPVSVRTSGRVATGEDLMVIGHPVGLPRKYAGGATVRDNNPAEYFEANLDTYGGNSGSGVFNINTRPLQLEGILVRGNPDFVQDGPCDRSNVCPDTGCPDWEDVTRATEFSRVLTSYDVYLGTDPNTLQFLSTTTLTCLTNLPGGILQPCTTYYWRVDSRTIGGTTQGDLWSFRTAPLPCPTCLGDLNGDGWIMMADLFAMITKLGLAGPPYIIRECDPLWNTCADMDRNSWIMINDLFQLIMILSLGPSPFPCP